MTYQNGNQPNLESRGIVFQAVGFAAVGLGSAAILLIFAGSEHWTFKAFEICAVKLYWAFIAPLAAIFEGVRRMFETRGKIRQQMFEEGRAAGIAEGRAEGIAQTRANMERAGLPQDVIDSIVSNGQPSAQPNADDIDPRIKRYIDNLFAQRDK